MPINFYPKIPKNTARRNQNDQKRLTAAVNQTFDPLPEFSVILAVLGSEIFGYDAIFH